MLLDFWATWCPPCHANAPDLNKLYEQYGKGNLEIVGVSVGETPAIVEKYLGGTPHEFPIVVSAAVDLPRFYQVQLLPTYMVIDPEGTLVEVVTGDQGCNKLERYLKQAGLDTR